MSQEGKGGLFAGWRVPVHCRGGLVHIVQYGSTRAADTFIAAITGQPEHIIEDAWDIALISCSVSMSYLNGYRMVAKLPLPKKVPMGRPKLIDYFRFACQNGHLDIASVLAERFALTPDEMKSLSCKAFRGACANGDKDTAQWLAKECNMTTTEVQQYDNYAFRKACRSGHMEIAQWLANEFKLDSSDARSRKNYAFRLAYRNEYYDIAYWLVSRFGLGKEDILSCDCEVLYSIRPVNESIAATTSILEKCVLGPDDIRGRRFAVLRAARRRLDDSVAEWLISLFCIDDNVKGGARPLLKTFRRFR